MHALKDRILSEGKDLGNGILKVDGFINHQVDPALMFERGSKFAGLFQGAAATKVLTACPTRCFLTLSPSHTRGTTVELIVSPKYLTRDDRVLIIDDGRIDFADSADPS